MSTSELLIEQPSDIKTLMDVVKKHSSIVVHIKRDLFDIVDSILKKEMIISLLHRVGKDYITLEVSYPENMVRIHRNILYKSSKLSYPDVLMYFLKTSSYVEHRVCKSYKDFSSALQDICEHDYRFIIFYPDNRMGRGYIVCGGPTGEVLATIYEEAVTYLGVEAIRFMFFRLPATLFIYAVRR